MINPHHDEDVLAIASFVLSKVLETPSEWPLHLMILPHHDKDVCLSSFVFSRRVEPAI